MAVSTSRLEFLASAILENTKLVDKYIKANDLPSLSFESSQPSHLFFPLEIEAARRKIIDSTQELHQLCSGAKEILYSHHVSEPPRPSFSRCGVNDTISFIKFPSLPLIFHSGP
jgi:hypothetical protein